MSSGTAYSSVLVIGYDKYPPTLLYQTGMASPMAVTRLAYQLQEGHNYIDLAQALAITHRNSHKNQFRQKNIYTVLGGMFVNNNIATTSKLSVATVPNTWYVKAAINRCFNAWKSQRARTLANTETDGADLAVGKYSDFKIMYNSGGLSNYLVPVAAGTTASRGNLATGEWNYASVVDEAGSEAHFMVLGNHAAGSKYAALKGWVETRALPRVENDPNMPDLNADSVKDYKVDFLNNLNETEDSNPERMVLLYEDNDKAPFHVTELYHDLDDDFNDQFQGYAITSATNPTAMIPGFKAVCGLIRIYVDTVDEQPPILFLDVSNDQESF